MSICDIPGVSTVCTAIGEGPAGLFFGWIASAMGLAVSTLFQGMWDVFSTTTSVDVTSDGYVKVYNILFGIAVFVTLLFFCFQLITGLARRDPSALTRAALGVAKSVLGSFVLITCTALLLEITDQLCVGIIQATGQTIESMGDRLALLITAVTITSVAGGAGALLTIFLAGLMIAAIFILWFSLLIRKALLLVAIVFGPVALAGLTWEASRGWFGKWATFVVALIASKLVIVVILLIATTQVAAPISLDLKSLSEPIAGIVLLFVAAFAPYMAYKFLSFVGFDMYQASSMEQEAKNALNRPVPLPSKPNGPAPKQVLDNGDAPATAPKTTPTQAPAPAAPAAGSGAAGAGGGGAAAGAGGGGAAAGGAAAAGPAAAVVGAAIVVKETATAGPKLGGAIGDAADGHAGSASEPAAPPPGPPVQQPPAVLPPPSPPRTDPPAPTGKQ
ncbi:type IV secretion system protein [Leucobacter rhizosphaerae]|uniref:Type IV secretion system protein n=1 Tax=Leucobacter rhizosphaerae TaxID=2932245 RepID=A0ABY4FYZ3_9MICO|nr:type IV secretion system protein [Leucobacter rhizosphaerae]UOQ61522.1 type IV secretion system protein [Leucobacter rhizosphaerae]